MNGQRQASRAQQERPRQSGATGAAREPDWQPSSRELEAIIKHGDAELLVSSAQKVGTALSKSLSTSQLRGVFGTLRRIQMRWQPGASPDHVACEMKELRLLKPRLAYQAGRARQGSSVEGRGISDLEPVLRDAIDLVTCREEFRHLVDYLEAIVAYHRFAGGR